MTRHIGSIKNNSDQNDSAGKGGTKTLIRPENLPEDVTKKPSLYKVILLNDDFTPMDFVIEILQKIFKKNPAEANLIMLQVHNQGAGVAGVYSFEIAETKAFQVNHFARQSEHPLKCTVEKE